MSSCNASFGFCSSVSICRRYVCSVFPCWFLVKGRHRATLSSIVFAEVFRQADLAFQCRKMMRIPARACWRTFIVFCVFGLVIICNVKSEELQCSSRHVLNGIDLPRPANNSCTYESKGQVLAPSDCTVWDLSDGEKGGFSDCSNLIFSNSRGYVTDVDIIPRPDSPNFTINFRNIQWHYMQYRMQIGENKMCQKLLINSSLEVERALGLSFSCEMFGVWAAGEDAELLLDVGQSPDDITGHAHFVMKIPEDHKPNPSNENISSTEILVAVDISHKPHLLVQWPEVSKLYNVTEYKVQLEYEDPRVVHVSSCRERYCSCVLFAGYGSRSIRVSVQPVHADCLNACYSYSPLISLELILPVYFLVLILLVPVLVLLIILCFTYFFCCAFPREPLEVLLLFDATEKQHCRVVRILAEYLKDVCGVHCLIDEEEIPRSESQNPYKWLHKTLDEAHAVVYVASPSSHLDMRYSEYPNVVYDALPLIHKRRGCPSHNRPGHFLVVVPPYCLEENIPECLRTAPRFNVPQELSWLLWSLYNQHCWVPPFTWIVKAYLGWCGCPGPVSAYRTKGARLEEALNAASATQLLTEQLPHTPKDSRKTIGTHLRDMDVESETSSMPYKHFPGDVNVMPLLGPRGSVPSSESLPSKMPIVLDTLKL